MINNIIELISVPFKKFGSERDPHQPASLDVEEYASMPLQFTVGVVTEVMNNPKSPSYVTERDMNAVMAIKNSEFKKPGATRDIVMLKSDLKKLYQPLLRGIQDIPTAGDPVLLCSFEGINYYLGPLNTFNNPNFNPDTGLSAPATGHQDLRRQLFVNPELDWNPEYKTLHKPTLPVLDEEGGLTSPEDPKEKFLWLSENSIGDMLFQGRFGNSIRIGSRGKSPTITLSNSRKMNNTVETLNDGAIIFMSRKGRLSDHWRMPFTLYSNITGLKNNRPLIFEDKPERKNLLIDSDTIIINAKGDGLAGSTESGSETDVDEGIILSSYSNIKFGTGDSFELSTNNSTLIDSRNIYFGKTAMKDHKEGKPVQPMVLGEELRLLLLEVVEILETFKVTGTIAGLSSMPAPDVLSKLTKLKNNLNMENKALFESEFHFIETNDTEK